MVTTFFTECHDLQRMVNYGKIMRMLGTVMEKISVRTSTIPAFGSLITNTTMKEVQDKTYMQLQSFLSDPSTRDNHTMLVQLVVTMGHIVSSCETWFREEGSAAYWHDARDERAGVYQGGTRRRVDRGYRFGTTSRQTLQLVGEKRGCERQFTIFVCRTKRDSSEPASNTTRRVQRLDEAASSSQLGNTLDTILFDRPRSRAHVLLAQSLLETVIFRCINLASPMKALTTGANAIVSAAQ
uniref:Uncharacterized protein n=1 Tax=Timema monikensis TaxID=170555 RepID=A0A7R9E5F5_9NEOP|nr:unnamed protein product [Timema monikensis]